MKRNYVVGSTFAVVVVALVIGSWLLDKQAAVEAAGVQAPRFEVDPMWPKPLPNHWVIGAVIGVAVDAKDNVWIIHRAGSLEAKEQYLTQNPVASECCAAAPAVLEFNAAGDLIGHWEVRGRVTTGLPPITALTSTTKETSGSVATGVVHSLLRLLPTRARWRVRELSTTASS